MEKRKNKTKKSQLKNDREMASKEALSPFEEEDIAHSSDPERGQNYTQRYSDHIINTKARCLKTFKKAVPYLNFNESIIFSMEEILSVTSEYHDIGKLDPKSQDIINGGHKDKQGRKRAMINHVDAGVAVLIKIWEETQNPNALLCAMLIDGHHIGLLNKILNKDFPNIQKLVDDIKKEEFNILRDDNKIIDKYPEYKDFVSSPNETVREYIDRILPELLKKHKKWIKTNTTISTNEALIPMREHPFLVRFLLSCLAEGDHWDTGRHYKDIAPDIITFPHYAEERIKYHMKKYGTTDNNNSFPEPKNICEYEKNKVRRLIHRDCELFPIKTNFYGLYAFPGYGKTLSGFLLALRLVEAFKMRGIIYMAPYNNILLQNIEKLIEFFVLPGEKSGEVIGEHYQEASVYERSKEENMNYHLLKYYSTKWNTPFEIVSVVQFFETLASNHPVKLRKFHQIAGRVIIIDEFHNAIPVPMQRQVLIWLKELTEYFGCKVIFMSGSPVKFWEIEQFKSCNIEVGEILSRKSIREMNRLEKNRVKYRKVRNKFTILENLYKKISSMPGPQLVIFNTVHTAALFSNFVKLKYGRNKLEHLSTVFTRKDRKKRLEDIKKRLSNPNDNKWILIATSCVESGLDLSFRTGFREERNLLSLMQTGGRVNRNNEYGVTCDVFSFSLDHDAIGGTPNQADDESIAVLKQLFRERKIKYKYSTESIRRESYRHNKNPEKLTELERVEKNLAFGEVAEKAKIIKHPCKTIIVDENLSLKINNGEVVKPWEIMEGSVQIFYTKLNRPEFDKKISVISREDGGIPLEEYIERKVKCPKEFYIWTGEYDSDVLGYMKDILRDLGHPVD